VDGDRGLDCRMKDDGDRVQADGLDWLVERDLDTGEREAAGLQRFGEIAAGYRAIEVPGLAGLTNDDECLPVELLGDGRGFVAALKVAGFDVGALRLKPLAVGVRGPERLALWK